MVNRTRLHDALDLVREEMDHTLQRLEASIHDLDEPVAPVIEEGAGDDALRSEILRLTQENNDLRRELQETSNTASTDVEKRYQATIERRERRIAELEATIASTQRDHHLVLAGLRDKANQLEIVSAQLDELKHHVVPSLEERGRVLAAEVISMTEVLDFYAAGNGDNGDRAKRVMSRSVSPVFSEYIKPAGLQSST